MVTFADGETIKSIVVPVSGDTEVETDETFALEISVDESLRDQVAFATTYATTTIAKDDGAIPPRFDIEAIAAIKPEGGDNQTTDFLFRVVRLENTKQAVTIDYSVSGLGFDPAKADDFLVGSLPTGRLAFASEETEQTLLITVAGDSLLERNERFQVTLLNPSAGVIGEAMTIGMIENEDAFVSRHSILPVDNSRAEGNEGTTDFTFLAVRNGNIDVATTVDFRVRPAGNHSADASDFGGSLPTGSVAFAVDEEQKTVTIAATVDYDPEEDEGFSVSLMNPSTGVVTGEAANATIVNDDAPLPSLSIWRVGDNLPEGDMGVTAIQFAVVRSGNLDVPSTVEYEVTGNGLQQVDANDFGGALPTGSLSFGVGQDFMLLTVDVMGDHVVEGDEQLTISLANPDRAVLEVSSAAVDILNDDVPPPELSIAPDSAANGEGDSGLTAFTFAVTRSGDLSTETTVSYSISGVVTADDFFDRVLPGGTIVFAPASAEKLVAIEVAGDREFEPDEAFAISLHDPVNGTLVGDSADGMIFNDDAYYFKLGDAPEQLPRSNPQNAWATAWTAAGASFSHKADYANIGEPWTPVSLNGLGATTLAGGDLFGGDLGVSGQNQATSFIRQEIDGAEALSFALDKDANEITIGLSRFYAKDDGLNNLNESGRLQVFKGGELAGELVFWADDAGGKKSVTLAVDQGFDSLVLTSGAYDDHHQFIYGAYVHDDDTFAGEPFAANGALHGSDFLVDVMMVGIAPAEHLV